MLKNLEIILKLNLKNKIKINFFDEFLNSYILPLREIKISIKIEIEEKNEEGEGNAFREIEFEDVKLTEFNYLKNNEIEFILEKNGNYFIEISFDHLNIQSFFKCISPEFKFSNEIFDKKGNF